MEKIDRLVWAAGLAFDCHGARIGIRVNDPALLDRVLPHLPPGWRPATTPVVDTLYSVLIARNDPRARVRNYHLLYSDAARLARTMEPGDVFQTLESDLHTNVSIFARRRLLVHAGVVGWRGTAVVIPGRSMSGKSTLVEALVKAGATYYSDEYAIFDTRGWVHPYPKPLSMRHGSDGTQTNHPVEELGGTPGTKPLPVGLVVVTKYRTGMRWRPKALSPAEAMLALLNNTVMVRYKPKVALTTLGRAVAGTSALKGSRGEAREVASQLLDFLQAELHFARLPHCWMRKSPGETGALSNNARFEGCR